MYLGVGTAWNCPIEDHSLQGIMHIKTIYIYTYISHHWEGFV